MATSPSSKKKNGVMAAASSSDWVTLNVGGSHFTTTRATLSKARGSFLWRLVNATGDEDGGGDGSGENCSQPLESMKDETGAYLIDRDPTYFGPVLNYLRHGKLVIDRNLAEEGVLEEAEFYNIAPLIALVKERIHNRDHRGSSDGRHLVYRVLHCHEDELANLVSTLSDGWRFEQILKIRTDRSGNYHHHAELAGAANHVELLCLVSKDYPPNLANGGTSEKAKSLKQQGSRM